MQGAVHYRRLFVNNSGHQLEIAPAREQANRRVIPRNRGTPFSHKRVNTRGKVGDAQKHCKESAPGECMPRGPFRDRLEQAELADETGEQNMGNSLGGKGR